MHPIQIRRLSLPKLFFIHTPDESWLNPSSPFPSFSVIIFPPFLPPLVRYNNTSDGTMSSTDLSSLTMISVVSKCIIYPHQISHVGDLKLSVSDLPMLSCHYIQKGLLFSRPPIPIHPLLSLLTRSLSVALYHFPALAGRLVTHIDGSVYISSNHAGVDFVYASSPSLTLSSLLPDVCTDTSPAFKALFALDGAISYDGHTLPLAAFQLTELSDGAIFIGCTANHAAVDGTSFWNFFNTWAELCRTGVRIPAALRTPSPDFRRNYFGDSKAVITFPGGHGPDVTFDIDAPLRERIFRFTRESILKLKSSANNHDHIQHAEICGKNIHDRKVTSEVSSFQALCALMWKSVTRARKYLPPDATTTFRMAVNCRRRVHPPVDAFYFGNAIQSIATTAAVADVATNDLRWSAELLHASVSSYDSDSVKLAVAEWEAAPRCFPLGNPDGSGLTMGSSPRFPMYDGNDFGWGRPLAIRSGKANKFDGKMSAFPAREGRGSVELEVCLAPETMAALIADDEFMEYVSEPTVRAVKNGIVEGQQANGPVSERCNGWS